MVTSLPGRVSLALESCVGTQALFSATYVPSPLPTNYTAVLSPLASHLAVASAHLAGKFDRLHLTWIKIASKQDIQRLHVSQVYHKYKMQSTALLVS
jgi:hypothetical protein